MPRYEVLQDYRSGAYGPWEQGAKVELDEHEAAWVNRDSSGTLTEIPPLGAEPEAKPKRTRRQAEEPREERQAGDQGAMTTADHPGITRPRRSR